MNKPRVRCFGSSQPFVNMLKDTNQDFIVQSTSSTDIIITEKQKRIYNKVSQRFVSKGEMILQKKLKKDIEKKTENQLIIRDPKDKVKYFRFDKSIREMSEMLGEIVSIKNLIEMDITMAYYQVAFNLGYMSKEMLDISKDIPKYMRLRLLGSIASRKMIDTYSGNKLIDTCVKEDQKMRDIYFNIRKKTDEIIIECADAIRDYFIFYWVDGIYFKKDEKIKDDLLQPSVEIIKYIFEKHNLAYTTKSIEKMIIINENKNIYLQLFNNGIKKSEFYVPRNDVKQYYIENEHGFYKEILAEHI